MLCSITEQLTSEKLQAVKLWITAGPREKFTAAELELLKQRLDSGGGLLVMLREGGELKYDTNINFLLEELGKYYAVIRNVYHKYFHPKEALVSSGVLNREISRAAGLIDEENTGNDLQCLRALTFVYPYGATLNVMKPTGFFCALIEPDVILTLKFCELSLACRRFRIVVVSFARANSTRLSFKKLLFY
uniref:Intraflagellar transport 52 homolog (Chlamydomonas) n=1 Tax=Cyprinus carpio TaxID=7962 RepID=A0A8C2I9X9_CYPCA